ncbi:MAG: hypothetical protein AAF865_01085 [Pseudomonadota bacterium]
MVDVHSQTEAIPAAYPGAPDGLSDKAAAISSNVVWQRIEAYIGRRYTEREIEWVLEGSAGDQWRPPIGPLVSRVARFWGDQWELLTLLDGPHGICLPFDGSYQITATVGAGPVPAAVSEAYRRLAEYLGEAKRSNPNLSSYKMDVGGLDISYERPMNWSARALIHSGAADLLRHYRRAA